MGDANVLCYGDMGYTRYHSMLLKVFMGTLEENSSLHYRHLEKALRCPERKCERKKHSKYFSIQIKSTKSKKKDCKYYLTDRLCFLDGLCFGEAPLYRLSGVSLHRVEVIPILHGFQHTALVQIPPRKCFNNLIVDRKDMYIPATATDHLIIYSHIIFC